MGEDSGSIPHKKISIVGKAVKVALDKMPNLKAVLDEAGFTSLPKANVAVLVGTAMDPSRSKRPANLPSITINTIWGEMAAQLAISAGKPELYTHPKQKKETFGFFRVVF